MVIYQFLRDFYRNDQNDVVIAKKQTFPEIAIFRPKFAANLVSRNQKPILYWIPTYVEKFRLTKVTLFLSFLQNEGVIATRQCFAIFVTIAIFCSYSD